ncbi:hypothetical protein HYH03_012129 [Edaphochlamys debaryana]|uniref:Uncharacterized protein n=1 Tax=Edaphochlamys debaryana TaxID=47281 RepID=A0A836BUR8_9CHLO|nr:hypothetical protein HYH03_012129 [Edaphochlamys debaryana]|eukprot:KAG2489297.1 hypothetical protein HYH03_012129 [Edaphochlamys debaryana]
MRRAQHCLAGPSGRCARPPTLSRPACRPVFRPVVAVRSNGKTITPSPLFDEVAEEEGWRKPRDMLRLTSPQSANPDYDDPDWMSRVEDWDEFWNAQSWELEVEDLDTEEGNMAGPDEAVRRAEKLVEQFEALDMRTDIINWMGTPHSEDMFEVDKWENPPVPHEKPDPNPALTPWDLRAMAEKARQRELMDIEWRRQQSRIGKLKYEHMDSYRDKRAWGNHFPENYRFDWTEEEIRQLIINNGIACKPEDHGALVENPYLPADYHALGVRYIEETEELLERTGHFATPNLLEQFDREFVIHGAGDEEEVVEAAYDEEDEDEYYDEEDEGEAEEDDGSVTLALF